MLIEFRTANHRSLRDEQVLTMEVGRGSTVDDDRVRQVPGHSDQMVTVAGIYGANASGKSNVISALAFMREAVLLSHRTWSPDDGVPREQFAWGPKHAEPSTFEVTLLLGGVRYEYGFTASDERFLEEWMYAWPHGKKQMWFERDQDTFKFGENLRGENRIIEEVTRPNALFLSAAVQHRHENLQPIFSWFRAIHAVNLRHRRPIPTWHTGAVLAQLLESDGTESRQPTLFPSDVSSDQLLGQFRSMLRNADIGIEDLRMVQEDSSEPRRFRPRRFQLKHRSTSDNAWLPLEEESRGTQTLFHISAPLLQSIQSGGLLLVDELEASLHPSLAQEIVRQFNEKATNPRNAQLIFTTHDTNLLGPTVGDPVLRRDQVWLTEKDQEGASVLYPLTDFKPRKAENIERGYLQGRYGAIPFLGDFSLWQEVSNAES